MVLDNMKRTFDEGREDRKRVLKEMKRDKNLISCGFPKDAMKGGEIYSPIDLSLEEIVRSAGLVAMVAMVVILASLVGGPRVFFMTFMAVTGLLLMGAVVYCAAVGGVYAAFEVIFMIQERIEMKKRLDTHSFDVVLLDDKTFGERCVDCFATMDEAKLEDCSG